MKWNKWLENWDMTSLKITAPFLSMEWNPSEPDKAAAWELYIELLTRITTQNLSIIDGDEKTALDSIYSLFPTTRSIIKNNGRDCIEFTKIAVVVLNQKVRPFTAKWHRISITKGFTDFEVCSQFRKELEELQKILRTYTGMLAEMAGVEDLTQLEGD
ncbi:MAG: hypothetical protein AB1306_05445 [Nitrospirota bacterium]